MQHDSLKYRSIPLAGLSHLFKLETYGEKKNIFENTLHLAKFLFVLSGSHGHVRVLFCYLDYRKTCSLVDNTALLHKITFTQHYKVIPYLQGRAI